ncbi:hypothetical protein Fleli_1608 [Bernardetia litoralis DSM 6794]|uniref:Uncharacterized protein n=1 Tax=Bernardetia litoralis (strain ATCC 23117 / DSM 6794 / NBRC 15988 / NCIMB 1366 / Fx l1 / Sio-4) TaxID=880071 RepID=I4AJ91_BERLS|nr:hypothetical protein [Bernardetia litoralis]AFM04026.1 hypothetical protein Fleli_1608 [Bernardetia litoralis DSM 6794]
MQFKIVALDILEANLIAPPQNLSKEIIFQFDINIEHRWNTDDEIFIVVTTVSIFSNDKEHLLSKFKTNTVFKIAELAKHVDTANSKNNMPTDVILDLNELAISTTRGSLFSFLKGTYLHNAILPIINQTIPA